MSKTTEEIEALKKNWLNDPCWDIENTEGFEDHVAELTAFHELKRKEWEQKTVDHVALRRVKVAASTGVDDWVVGEWLSTFDEIEKQISDQGHYLNEEYLDNDEIVRGELAQAQARATLLLAAQTKRIADVLERFVDSRE